MADENELLREMSINIAIILTKLEETEKKNIDKRLAVLEKNMNLAIGALLLINFALGVYSALRK